MDCTSIKTNSCTSDISLTSSLSAKIRRLQIEESLLLQSINKCVPEGSQTESEIEAKSFLKFSEFKAFSAKTKNSHREIKLLFQDIKTRTSSKEMLKSLDIDDVKRSTLELESSIKAFKSYLQAELARLKSAEQNLNKSLNENPVLINKLKRQPRIQTAKYNEIMPSPVKTMMNSPFKCLEVQQFQEFMMNSANRYGGWKEYHHNIFVNYWQKYFGSQVNASYDGTEHTVENSPIFHLFSHELLPLLQDVSEEEIISHVKWYSKYVYLKERQQEAIDKWRSNRKMMKSAKVEPEVKKEGYLRNRNKGRNDYIDINSTVSDQLSNIKDLVPQLPDKVEVRCFVRKCLSDDIQQGKIDISDHVCSSNNLNNAQDKTLKDCEDNGDLTMVHFQKSTKQWLCKVNSKNIKIETNLYNLENIKKLCIPTWRLGL